MRAAARDERERRHGVADDMAARVGRPVSGFTILELLCAMVVLLLIAMMMGDIFNHSRNAWAVGMGRAENNTAGRAALDFLVRDLSQAVADTNFIFLIRPDKDDVQTFGVDASEMCFVAVQHNPDDNSPRAAREVFYYLGEMKDAEGREIPNRYELKRGYTGAAIYEEDSYADHCYHTTNWVRRRPSSSEVLVENVAAFQIRAYAYDAERAKEKRDESSYVYVDEYDSMLRTAYGDPPFVYENRLPVYVDVLLEVLTEDDAVKASVLTEPEPYVERQARRYTARVWFNNRDGYLARVANVPTKEETP